MNELKGRIKNLGQTCYISCTIQILFRFNPFLDEMKALANNGVQNGIIGIIIQLIQNFYSNEEPIDISVLTNYMNIDTSRPNDICEFISKLLDLITEELPSERKLPFRKVFMPTIQSLKKEESDIVLFYTIPVDPNLNTAKSIESSMKDNQERFFESSKAFFVQMQRMLFDTADGLAFKDNRIVEIDFNLNFREFGGETYSIYAIIHHFGSGLGGHYIAHIRDEKGWIFTSDSLVKGVTEEQVLGSICSNDSPAYVIVYTSNPDDIQSYRKPHIQEENSLLVLFKYFDASAMTVFDYSIMVKTSEEAKAEIEVFSTNIGGYTRNRYIYNNSEYNSIPIGFGSRIPDSILVIVEKKSYRFFPQEALMVEPLQIFFHIEKTHFNFSAKFHPEQNISNVENFLNSYFTGILKLIKTYWTIQYFCDGFHFEVKPGYQLFLLNSISETTHFTIFLDKSELKTKSINVKWFQNYKETKSYSIKVSITDNIQQILIEEPPYPYSIFLKRSKFDMIRLKNDDIASLIYANKDSEIHIHEKISSDSSLFIFVENDNILKADGRLFFFPIFEKETIIDLQNRIRSIFKIYVSITFFYNNNTIKPNNPYETYIMYPNGKFLVSTI